MAGDFISTPTFFGFRFNLEKGFSFSETYSSFYHKRFSLNGLFLDDSYTILANSPNSYLLMASGQGFLGCTANTFLSLLPDSTVLTASLGEKELILSENIALKRDADNYLIFNSDGNATIKTAERLSLNSKYINTKGPINGYSLNQMGLRFGDASGSANFLKYPPGYDKGNPSGYKSEIKFLAGKDLKFTISSDENDPWVQIDGLETPLKNRTVIVAEDGHAQTIEAAIDIITAFDPPPSLDNPSVILLYAGHFTENNPLTLPPGVQLSSVDSSKSSIIRAVNPDQPVFYLGADTGIGGITIEGASASGGVAFQYAGPPGIGINISSCTVFNCHTVVKSDIPYSIINVKDLIANVRDTSESLSVIFDADNSAVINISNCTCNGLRFPLKNIGLFANVKNNALLIGEQIQLDRFDKITEVDSGSHLTISNSHADHYIDGIHLGLIDSPSLGLLNMTMRADGGENYSVLVESSGSNIRFISCFMQRNLVHIPSNANFVGNFVSNEVDQSANINVGVTSIGDLSHPSQLTVGAGAFNAGEFTVLRNTDVVSGAWTNVTTEATSVDTPFDAFPGPEAGNTLYLGSDRPFPGVEVSVSSPAIDYGNGELIWEHFNLGLPVLFFSSGGSPTILAGYTIQGKDSGVTATANEIFIYSGSWASGNATGYITLVNVSGTTHFSIGETLNLPDFNIGGPLLTPTKVTGCTCTSGWLRTTRMTTESIYPFNQLGNVEFVSPNQLTDTRFGEIPSWGLSTLPGDPFNIGDKYWIRCRIRSEIDVIPSLDYFRGHTDSTRINKSGHLEFFGRARGSLEIPSHLGLCYYTPGGAGSEDLNFSPNIVLSPNVDNSFMEGEINGFGSTFKIPSNLDTSLPIYLSVIWAPLSNGNGEEVELLGRYTIVRIGEKLDGTGFELAGSQKQIIGPNDENTLFSTTYRVVNETVRPGDVIGWSLARDSESDPRVDNFPGDIYVVAIRLWGANWTA